MECENCKKQYKNLYGSGRFCCERCARTFSSKSCSGMVKSANCIKCGKTVEIKNRASTKTCLCSDCKPTRNGICKICGRTKNKNGKCDNKFCQRHNPQRFISLIKYFNFDKSKYGTIEVENEFNRVRNILYNLYWVENKSSSDIAKLYNYKSSCTNITQKFFKKYLDIPVKCLSYSVRENYIEGRNKINNFNNQYKQQWHTTWDGYEVFLRSSYELDYAKELDSKKIHYEVESLKIKYFDTLTSTYRCAIPDFYIPSLNLIVEIKSTYTLNVQNMKDKMAEYNKLGYTAKLICDHKELEL